MLGRAREPHLEVVILHTCDDRRVRSRPYPKGLNGRELCTLHSVRTFPQTFAVLLARHAKRQRLACRAPACNECNKNINLHGNVVRVHGDIQIG